MGALSGTDQLEDGRGQRVVSISFSIVMSPSCPGKTNSHPKAKAFINDIALVLSISVMSQNRQKKYKKTKPVISPGREYLCNFLKLSSWGSGGAWRVWVSSRSWAFPILVPRPWGAAKGGESAHLKPGFHLRAAGLRKGDRK